MAINNKTLYVDMDGTLAKWKYVGVDTLHEEGYYKNLDPMENVINAVRSIHYNNPEIDIKILSSVLSTSQYAQNEKNEWLDQYLPEIEKENRIFVPYGTDKREFIGEIKDTDFLLDDFTKNLESWSEQGTGIKLLNGINHTKGTWDGNKLDSQKEGYQLAADLQQIINNERVIQDRSILTMQERIMLQDAIDSSAFDTAILSSDMDQYSEYLGNNEFKDILAVKGYNIEKRQNEEKYISDLYENPDKYAHIEEDQLTTYIGDSVTNKTESDKLIDICTREEQRIVSAWKKYGYESSAYTYEPNSIWNSYKSTKDIDTLAENVEDYLGCTTKDFYYMKGSEDWGSKAQRIESIKSDILKNDGRWVKGQLNLINKNDDKSYITRELSSKLLSDTNNVINNQEGEKQSGKKTIISSFFNGIGR